VSLVGLGQGVPFFHAGVELLRSKSLDRNSYNSGDWFNKLDFTAETNNWGVGLPPQADNGTYWPIMAPLLANPALKASATHIDAGLSHFKETLAIRGSTRLFRLGRAAEIERRVRFHNTGPAQAPGLVVMSVADADGTVDRGHDLAVVFWNGTDEDLTFADASLQGRPLVLHPLQAASADPVVRTARLDADGFHVPARTAAVFWAARPAADQLRLLQADVAALVAGGALNHGQGNALHAKLASALRQLERGQPLHALQGFLNQLDELVIAGVLSAEQADPLRAAVEVLRAQAG
jgi:pullulanase/glycogen debranching enzyme